MHSLPDNALNPLGLLAEASLANRRAQANAKASSSKDVSNDKVGVASDVYFKPGECALASDSIYVAELRSHVLTRAYDDSTATATVHRAANPA